MFDYDSEEELPELTLPPEHGNPGLTPHITWKVYQPLPPAGYFLAGAAVCGLLLWLRKILDKG